MRPGEPRRARTVLARLRLRRALQLRAAVRRSRHPQHGLPSSASCARCVAWRRAAVPPWRAGRRGLPRGKRLPRRLPPRRGRCCRGRAGADRRHPTRPHRRRDVAAVAQPRTRSVAALRDSEVWRLSQESFDAAHRTTIPGAARPDAQRRGAQCHGAEQCRRQPRTFALLPARSDVPRHASRCCSRSGPRPDRRTGADAQPGSLHEVPEWFARCEMDTPSCSIVPIRPSRRGPSFACAGRLPGRGVRHADSDKPHAAVPDEAPQPSAVVSSPPRAGAAAPRPRSEAGFDGPASSPAACTASITMSGSTYCPISTGWRG